jgi:CubicO group peptidase (beta-lactamase class C family)
VTSMAGADKSVAYLPATDESVRRADSRDGHGKRHLSTAAIYRSRSRGQTAVGDAGDRPPFRAYATDKKTPGMTWGVVIDGQLAHRGSFGVRDRASQAPITPDTAFRIASMTKSFTALAVLKLRDNGRLSLEDPVSRWIPEFARVERPTRDTPPLTIRQLLSHSAGLPEDNPWGDQQLSATDAMMDDWLAKGIPFSTPPGTRYEYSNYAFALLGRIVTKASGVPYERYMQDEILSKLQMDGSTFEFADVPAARRAIGYRLKPDGSYAEEPPLPHGVFGAMGGLLTTATDLGKYVAFHLSAWPPRDDDDSGTCASRLAARDGAPVDAVEPDGATCQRHAAGVRDWLRLRAARDVGLSLRADRGARGRIAGVRILHGVAAGLRCGDVRNGDADVFGALRSDQPGVGRDAQNRRAAQARAATHNPAERDPRAYPEPVEALG